MEANEVTAKPSVLAIGLKFGLILGLISVVVGLIQYVAGINPMDNQWTTNLINIALTVGAVVFAHKNFKEIGNGFMSYGQGLGIAMVVVAVSMVIGGIYTYVYFNILNPAAYDGIWEKAAADMEAQGQSEEAIETALSWTKKLFWPFFIIGALFWGFIIGLIVSIFTQKKEPETAF
jgi:hypothetical protein